MPNGNSLREGLFWLLITEVLWKRCGGEIHGCENGPVSSSGSLQHSLLTTWQIKKFGLEPKADVTLKPAPRDSLTLSWPVKERKKKKPVGDISHPNHHILP